MIGYYAYVIPSNIEWAIYTQFAVFALFPNLGTSPYFLNSLMKIIV